MRDRALSVRDVTELYAVNEHTVLAWIRSGELRAVNVGRSPSKKKPRWRITSDALAAFDWVVVEPAYVPSPPRTVAKTEVMAYLAVGEMQPSRPYFADVPAAWRRGENPAWSSIIIDQTDPAWPRFVVERIARPLWNAGYRGFFLDTLDAYHLVAKTPLGQEAPEQARERARRGIEVVRGLADGTP